MTHSTRKPTLWAAKNFDLDLPKHAALANPDRHISPPVDFLFQESLLYTSIPLRRNVSARISMCGLRRLILVDTLRTYHNIGFARGTAIMSTVSGKSNWFY